MALNEANAAKNKELWSRFISGDDNAFAGLYTLNVNSMLNYGLHFTPLRDQIKDSIHDVFVSIYNRRASLGSVENVRVYLFVALKNRLFTLFNKSMDYYQIDTIEPVFNLENSVEEMMISNEMEEERTKYLKRMLNTLSPRQREVMFYRFSEGMDFDEICVLMQMNLQSVRNLLHRSIAKIRKTYGEFETIYKND